MPDEDLRTTVEMQAQAHVQQDAARFASYMTPAALVELGRTSDLARGIIPRRSEIIDVRAEGDAGASQVRFTGRGSYVIYEVWERTTDGWKVTTARRPRELIRQPWWRRWLPGAGVEPPPDRQELN